jgi:phosphoadenosine phosphosulfate reductase
VIAAPGGDAAGALNRRLEAASASEIIAAARDAVAPGRLAVVSSFGTESGALLKLVADIDRTIPVLFLDTGWLFAETLAYRDRVAAHLGLQDVRSIEPSRAALGRLDPSRELWSSDPDACCGVRKVEPLAQALAPFDAWLTGRKRYQGGERTALPIVEVDGGRLKFNPLARISETEVAAVFAASGLPQHPLTSSGYQSLGCVPCTSRTQEGESPRAGRWRGQSKTECGIHGPARYHSNRD